MKTICDLRKNVTIDGENYEVCLMYGNDSSTHLWGTYVGLQNDFVDYQYWVQDNYVTLCFLTKQVYDDKEYEFVHELYESDEIYWRGRYLHGIDREITIEEAKKIMESVKGQL